VNITHIPYRGSAPRWQDMLAGRIDLPLPQRGGRDPASRRQDCEGDHDADRDVADVPHHPDRHEQGEDFVAENWLPSPAKAAVRS